MVAAASGRRRRAPGWNPRRAPYAARKECNGSRCPAPAGRRRNRPEICGRSLRAHHGDHRFSGVPLIEALNSVAASAGNSVFAHEIRRIRDEVAGGRQISAAMRNGRVFPTIVVQMVAGGEEVGHPG